MCRMKGKSQWHWHITTKYNFSILNESSLPGKLRQPSRFFAVPKLIVIILEQNSLYTSCSYVSNSVFSQCKKVVLFSYTWNGYIPRIYIEQGSCSQIAAILHLNISKEACCGQFICLTVCLVFKNWPMKRKIFGFVYAGLCSSNWEAWERERERTSAAV